MAKLNEKQRNIQQVPFRLHTNDHKVLKSKCAIDGIKMQTLVEACVLAYLDGDQHVKTLALEFKNINTVNKKKTSWSTREQDKILAEIEEEGGENE